MAKSIEKRLQESLEKGDIETAKKLAAKIANKKVPKKITSQPEPSMLILPGNDNSWLAPSRPNTGNKIYARHESMQGRKHVNLFDDWEKKQGVNVDGMSKGMKATDKKMAAKVSLVPRPGMPGAKRSPAIKSRVQCDGCGKNFDVYPSEMIILDSETVYKCDRCARRGK